MLNQKKILIIEDDSLIRTLYKRALEKDGHAVDEASDGQEGYDKMSKGGYDIVLLDIMLPKLNGVDILNKLKETGFPKVPNKKIIVLSNLDEEVVKEDGEFYQIDGYLVKNKVDVTKLKDELKLYLQ